MPNFAAFSHVNKDGGNWAAASLIDDGGVKPQGEIEIYMNGEYDVTDYATAYVYVYDALVYYQEFTGAEVYDGIYGAELNCERWYGVDNPTILIYFDDQEYTCDYDDEGYYGARPNQIEGSEYPFSLVLNGSSVEIYVLDGDTHTIEAFAVDTPGGAEFISVLLAKTAFVSSDKSVFALVYSEVGGQYVYSPVNMAAFPNTGSVRYYVPLINNVGYIPIIDDGALDYVFDLHDSTDVSSTYSCPANVHIFSVTIPDGFVEVGISK